MKKNIAILFILLAFSSEIHAQKEKVIHLKAIRGEFSMVLEYSDITGREARQMARDDAKRKALEQACGSRVNIWDQIEISSAGETFNSLSVNQIDGEIIEFNIVDEGVEQSQARSEETVFYCIADVKVKKGVSPDPDFYAAVNGLRSVYYSGESLHIEVTPYRNSYMKIFLMEDDKTGYMLYPNAYDCAREIPAQNKVAVPSSCYKLELNKSSDNPVEINRLVFVFTKTERPFDVQVTSRSEIEKWIAAIPNDQKYLHFAVIEIRDN